MTDLVDLLNNNSWEKTEKEIKEFWQEYKTPKTSFELDNIKFDIVGEQRLSFSNDITDHYIENNVFVQDQVARKPMIYTVEGEVGELVYYQEEDQVNTVEFVNQKLAEVAAFAPSITASARQASDKILKASGWVSSLTNAYDRLESWYDMEDHLENKQQQIYAKLVRARNYRVPVKVSSPWAEFASFVVQDVELIQPRDTKDKTLIRLTMKEIRATSVNLVKFDRKNFQGRLKDQKAPITNSGRDNGTLTSTKFNIVDGFIPKGA